MKIKGSLPGSLKKFCSRGPTGGPSQTIHRRPPLGVLPVLLPLFPFSSRPLPLPLHAAPPRVPSDARHLRPGDVQPGFPLPWAYATPPLSSCLTPLSAPPVGFTALRKILGPPVRQSPRASTCRHPFPALTTPPSVVPVATQWQTSGKPVANQWQTQWQTSPCVHFPPGAL